MGGRVSSEKDGSVEMTEKDSILDKYRNVTPTAKLELGNGGETEEPRGCWKSMLGVTYALLSGILLGLCDTSMLLGIYGGMSPSQQVMIKSVIMIVVMVPLMMYYSVSILKTNRTDALLNVVKGTIENGADLAFYYSLSYIGIGDATAITIGVVPIITPILACMLSTDAFKLVHLATLAVNLTGILLISQPSFIFGSAQHGDMDVIGYVLAVASGAMLACGAVFTKVMSDDLSVLVMMIYNGICGVVMTLPLTFLLSQTSLYAAFVNDPKNVAYLVGMVGCYLPHLLTFNLALQVETATNVALLFNIQVVVGFVADIFVFDESANWLELLGAGLIFLSSVIVSVSAWRDNTRKGEGNDQIH